MPIAASPEEIISTARKSIRVLKPRSEVTAERREKKVFQPSIKRCISFTVSLTPAPMILSWITAERPVIRAKEKMVINRF